MNKDRVWKLFYCLIWKKEPCVRKFEGLTGSKILGISQTVIWTWDIADIFYSYYICQAFGDLIPGIPKIYLVSQINFNCLIWCKLKATVFMRFVVIFSKSSHFNLNCGIKQSKISWNFAEQWLSKVKISEPVDGRWPDFFQKIDQP